jgi:hypothetical protein
MPRCQAEQSAKVRIATCRPRIAWARRQSYRAHRPPPSAGTTQRTLPVKKPSLAAAQQNQHLAAAAKNAVSPLDKRAYRSTN